MTRFARAKGSRSANDREPEEATPWSVMVKGVRGREVRKSDLEDLYDEDAERETVEIREEETRDQEDVDVEDQYVDAAAAAAAPVLEEGDGTDAKKKKPRKKDKCLNCKEKGHMKMNCPQLSEERRKELQELLVMKVERKGKGTGRKKNKSGKKTSEAAAAENPVVSSSSRVSKPERNEWPKKELKDKTGQIVQDGEGLFQGFRVRLEDVKKLRKLQKQLLSKDTNPEEVKEVLKRERRRAEKELAKSKKMVCYQCRQPGHFLSECPTASKSASTSAAVHSGQCFKCGSDEHSSKDCQSKRKGEDAYRFAVCFICNESGHLAKACPDNPRGLYPKGGGCRFCGSVEHLKSECLRKVEKDSRDEVRAERMDDATLEVEPERKRLNDKKEKKKQRALMEGSVGKKVVKF